MNVVACVTVFKPTAYARMIEQLTSIIAQPCVRDSWRWWDFWRWCKRPHFYGAGAVQQCQRYTVVRCCV